MEILSLVGSLIASFIIFYVVVIGSLMLLVKLIFKPIPEDELIETERKVDSFKKIRRNRKLFHPSLSMAK